MSVGINEIFTEQFRKDNKVASVQYPRYRQIEAEICLDDNDEVVAIGIRADRKDPNNITFLDIGKMYIVEHPYGQNIPHNGEEVAITGFDVSHPNKKTGIPYVKVNIRNLRTEETDQVEIVHLKSIK